jgi:hypothetical protein
VILKIAAYAVGGLVLLAMLVTAIGYALPQDASRARR